MFNVTFRYFNELMNDHRFTISKVSKNIETAYN